MTVKSRRQLALNIQLDAYKKETIRNNRGMLKFIVECIILLGRNNLAFRGHKDDISFTQRWVNNQRTVLDYYKTC